MELAHGDVFQAASHQLLAALEHLRPDEPGHIVNVEPSPAGLDRREFLADGPAETILSRLEHHHVEAVSYTVGELRALAGLEVEPVSFTLLRPGILQDLVNRDVERLIAVVCPGE